MSITPEQALFGAVQSTVETTHGAVQFRSAGMAAEVTHVLLHGIGSASASWAFQLGAAVGRSNVRVLAWDAPGYGRSAHLPVALPCAQDYAERLWSWLDALSVWQPVVLVGHSLGGLMAASGTRLQPDRVKRLVLLAPARGYGGAAASEREAVVQGRLANLEKLGPKGMALLRGAAMLSPDASLILQEAVRQTMAQIDPAGYTQAVHMLGQAILAQDLKAIRCPVWVASGEADTVTSPQGCDMAAHDASQTRISLGAVGHACQLEAADAVNDLLGLSTLGELN
jgi:pimeloyl-ACP methyl ester carboxylesterase